MTPAGSDAASSARPFRAAIAGAGRGIGAACARALAAQGARLAICARDRGEIEAVARETSAAFAAVDLATDAGARAFAEVAFGALGEVDALLVCVGDGHALQPVAKADAALLEAMLRANAIAPALVAGAFAREWERRSTAPASADASATARSAGDRHILVLSSLVTRRPPILGAGPYTAGKAALEALVRALAEELWPRVRANALCLPAVATRLHERAGTPAAERALMPTPDEIAPLVLELLGPRGRGLTGRTIDAEALAIDAAAALAGDGRLALARPLQPLDANGPPALPEAEPGRRPSPRVRAAVRASAGDLQRYPDPGGELSRRLGALHGVEAHCIALSAGGATELIERALRAACAPGDEVLSPFPTFEVLSALCTRLGLRHRPVPAPRRADGLFAAHEARPLLAALGPRTRLVYVASPDNPTGATLSLDEERALRDGLPAGALLVVDEAWASSGTIVPERSFQNGAEGLLRLRSLSKLQGLAGLRVGYAVGSPDAVALLARLQLPYPLGAPQLAAALAMLDEPERTRRAALLSARERARSAAAIRALGLSVSDGDAPMLLIRDPSSRSAGRLLFALQAAGATAHEAHWDESAVVLALGKRADNRRYEAALRRALDR